MSEAANGEVFAKPLLSVRDLKVAFKIEKQLKEVVHGVSFDVYPGETVAIVGESGSGKTMAGRALLRLIRPPGRISADRMVFDGQDLLAASERDMRALRGKRIGVLCGGVGSEREVSLRTGRGIAEALRRQGFEVVEIDPQPPRLDQRRAVERRRAHELRRHGQQQRRRPAQPQADPPQNKGHTRPRQRQSGNLPLPRPERDAAAGQLAQQDGVGSKKRQQHTSHGDRQRRIARRQPPHRGHGDRHPNPRQGDQRRRPTRGGVEGHQQKVKAAFGQNVVSR